MDPRHIPVATLFLFQVLLIQVLTRIIPPVPATCLYKKIIFTITAIQLRLISKLSLRPVLTPFLSLSVLHIFHPMGCGWHGWMISRNSGSSEKIMTRKGAILKFSEMRTAIVQMENIL